MKIIDNNLLKDLNSEIRKNKISHLLNNNRKIDIIKPYDKHLNLNLLKYISQYGAITGSNLYSLYGMITRIPNDVDLLVDQSGLDKIKEKYKIISNDFYHMPAINSLGYIQVKFKNKYYDIDIILTNDISHTTIVEGIRIDNIFKSLNMKIHIYESNENRDSYRDERDLLEILSFFKK
jgi:hypothetical protein